VTSPYDRHTDYRAGQLAALVQLDIALPAAVRHAISAHQAAAALKAPARPLPGSDRRAAADAALDLVHAAVESSKRPGALPPLDAAVARISAARQAEQKTLDEITLVGEIRSAAAVVLCQAVAGENGRRIIAAMQDRHGRVTTELVERARRLPAGTDESLALELGGEVRESFLACRDLAADAARLRAALGLVDPSPIPREIPDGWGQCARHERSGRLYKHWLAPAGSTDYGRLDGSLTFWLAATASGEPYDWWLPTVAEAEERAAELREQHRVENVRLAGAHVM
jgi:hypothetical protein